MVRVWAEKSPNSDLRIFNIEWTPSLTLKVVHEFDLTYYPLDIQTILVKIESWMSIEGHGQIQIMKYSQANSLFKNDVD